MKFSLKPKERLDELYGRKEDVKKIKKSIKRDGSITLVYGPKGIGKTSAIISTKNSLNSSKTIDVIYLDMTRFLELNDHIGYQKFTSSFHDAVQESMNKRIIERFARKLQKNGEVIISPISTPLFQLMLRFKDNNKEENQGFIDLLEKLNEWCEQKNRKAVIVIDEAQLLRKIHGNILRSVFYAYKHLNSISFAFVGSEAGIHKVFLEEESPLYGLDDMTEIRLKPLDRDSAISYLKDGFEDRGYEFSKKDGKRVYEKIGGNPEWLTLYGINAIKYENSDKAIRRTIEVAKVQFVNELMDFLSISNPIDNPSITRNKFTKLMNEWKKGDKWEDIDQTLLSITGNKISEEDRKRIRSMLSNYPGLINDI